MKGMLLVFALVLAYCVPFIGIPALLIWATIKFRKPLAKLILLLA